MHQTFHRIQWHIKQREKQKLPVSFESHEDQEEKHQSYCRDEYVDDMDHFSNKLVDLVPSRTCFAGTKEDRQEGYSEDVWKTVDCIELMLAEHLYQTELHSLRVVLSLLGNVFELICQKGNHEVC